MSLSLSSVLSSNDSMRAPFGAGWMRGVTPARIGIVALVFFSLHVNNPSFTDDDFFPRFGRILFLMGQHVVAALPMLFLVVKTEIWTARSAPGVRVAALALAVVAGSALFAATRLGLRFGALPQIGAPGSFWEYTLGHFFRALFIGGLLTSILYFAERAREAQRRLHQTQLSRIEIDRQMTEARLQLLQAQIEPHFLFNSLASVKRLYEDEPASGRALLRNLGDYLRAAVRFAKQRETTLGEEIALARSFLAILQVRMGRRLRVQIDLPPVLESALIPPLMVGTLVENAVKHGIGPRGSGGFVSISARNAGEVLEVAVKDDGVGFRVRFGHGFGLANIRARLETLYVGAGSLDLAANAEGGVSATLCLPLRHASVGRESA
jgi:hypothetical protein